MSFIDCAVDLAIDRLMVLRMQRPERKLHFLSANVLQTISVSGGLV
jgi:hypothetical protein